MKKTSPAESVTNMDGSDSSAERAGPPSPVYPAVPVPATTMTYGPAALAGAAGERTAAAKNAVTESVMMLVLDRTIPANLHNVGMPWDFFDLNVAQRSRVIFPPNPEGDEL